MFRCTLPTFAAWWNYSTEKRQHFVMMYGGSPSINTRNALNRAYVRRFKRGAFPNRTRLHWNIVQNGVTRQRPHRMFWPYDITSMIFNQPRPGADKIGYVVGTSMMKTAVVAANHLVYFPKYNQRVARTTRFFAHDEDMSCVEGDLVHIKQCRKISKYKHYYIFSILEPNIEARERLKLGLRAVPPPLFGHPVSRRIVKFNLSSTANTKQKLASAIQEQVQNFYRFSHSSSGIAKGRTEDQGTFDDANRMVSPNAPATAADSTSSKQLPSSFGGEVEHDTRTKKGEEYWMNQEPKEKYDFSSFQKSP